MNDIKNIEELECKLASHSIPWDEVMPDDVYEWLNVFSQYHGCTKELLLVSMLGATGGIVGSGTTINVFNTWTESSNLFLIGLAPSEKEKGLKFLDPLNLLFRKCAPVKKQDQNFKKKGTGKTPSCKHGCVNPIVNYLEEKVDKQLLIDETSTNGLFNLLKSGSSDIPILCIDEANTFFSKLLCSGRSNNGQSLSMERLCKLYDGEYWYTLKGNKAKRVGVQNGRISLCAFMTPHKFLQEIWPKIVAYKNGLPDRLLMIYKGKERKDYDQMEQIGASLDDSPIKSLNSVYEAIYTEHHAGTPKSYNLTDNAKAAFVSHMKELEEIPSQLPSSQKTGGDAKNSKNILRLALNLHILWHRISSMLSLNNNSTSPEVSVEIINMAISLHNSMSTYRGIALKCVDLTAGVALKVGVSDEDLIKKILELPDAFLTAKKVYNSFSSTHRPSAAQTKKCIEMLGDELLGMMVHVNRSTVFYKALPIDAKDNSVLASFGISNELYLDRFNKVDTNMTTTLRKSLLLHHPFKPGYRMHKANMMIQNHVRGDDENIENDSVGNQDEITNDFNNWNNSDESNESSDRDKESSESSDRDKERSESSDRDKERSESSDRDKQSSESNDRDKQSSESNDRDNVA